MMGNRIIHVQFYGDFLTLLIAAIAPAVGLVEMTEEGLPSLLGRCFACQLHHSLWYHGVSLLLIIPTVFHPKSRLAVPVSDTRTMHPGHSPRMDALTNAYRFVRTDKEFGELWIEFTEEHPFAIDSFGEQLDGSGRTEVRMFPSPQLPDDLPFLIHLYGLHRGISRIHRHLVPLVVPIINKVMAILQTNRLLRLSHPEVCRIDLPYRLSLTIDLLNMTFATCDQQIARLRHLLNRPGQESVPTFDLLAVGIILMDAAQGHIGNQQRAA